MIDISSKNKTLRIAVAEAVITLQPETLQMVQQGRVPKGDPLTVAKVAAIQAAKNTSRIIPYCHPLPVEAAEISFSLEENRIRVETTVKAIHRTGVEMEALTAASVAALTLYDMLKMLDKDMAIETVRLLRKRGGKSDYRETDTGRLQAAVLVMSDSIAAGKKDDRSGQMIVERLKKEGVPVKDYRIIPDDPQEIKENLLRYSDEQRLDLVLTTGGTGFSRRDNTPEVMAEIIDREAPGIPETARAYGQERTPYSMLSRGKAGLRGKTLIVSLPGSKGGVKDSLDALFPGLLHAFKMIRGGGHEEKDSSQ
ncbi:MAG: bifunctional molybdenum cofactor biosynthesis protein MoaC/MoaB [Calditrichia bacterium]